MRVSKWGFPSSWAAKILNFLTIRAGWIKFSEWLDIKNKLNLTKIGVSPQAVPPKFKFFNHSRQTDKIFGIDKYKLKIKYDQISEYQNEGVSRGHQNSKFLTTHARHMKFSG